MTTEVVTHLLSALGPGGIACAMLVLARLSARMYETTRGTPAYRWFYVAALLLTISAAARVFGVIARTPLQDSWLWVILYDGLPAIAVMVGLSAAWHIWAWLLAERD